MLTAALEGLVARFGLQGERIGEVVAGAVLKHRRAGPRSSAAPQGQARRRRLNPRHGRAAGGMRGSRRAG